MRRIFFRSHAFAFCLLSWKYLRNTRCCPRRLAHIEQNSNRMNKRYVLIYSQPTRVSRLFTYLSIHVFLQPWYMPPNVIKVEDICYHRQDVSCLKIPLNVVLSTLNGQLVALGLQPGPKFRILFSCPFHKYLLHFPSRKGIEHNADSITELAGDTNTPR